MNDLKLGQIIETEQSRDAIHVAVAPVTAGERLPPGAHVNLIHGKAATSSKPIGIVDPFLKRAVMPGQKFWLFLYPQTVTSLRHEWEHPAFPKEPADSPDRPRSERWMRDFCDNEGLDYDDVLEHMANDGVNTGENQPDVTEEFRHHFLILTGKVCNGYFSCAC